MSAVKELATMLVLQSHPAPSGQRPASRKHALRAGVSAPAAGADTVGRLTAPMLSPGADEPVESSCALRE